MRKPAGNTGRAGKDGKLCGRSDGRLWQALLVIPEVQVVNLHQAFLAP